MYSPRSRTFLIPSLFSQQCSSCFSVFQYCNACFVPSLTPKLEAIISVTMAGSGYIVVPVQKAFTALRIIQVIIGVAVLALSCYPVSLTSGYGSAYIFEVSPERPPAYEFI